MNQQCFVIISLALYKCYTSVLLSLLQQISLSHIYHLWQRNSFLSDTHRECKISYTQWMIVFCCCMQIQQQIINLISHLADSNNNNADNILRFNFTALSVHLFKGKRLYSAFTLFVNDSILLIKMHLWRLIFDLRQLSLKPHISRLFSHRICLSAESLW